MIVVCDTTVWSLALRRRRRRSAPHDDAHVAELTQLILERRARLLGVVRQELLSGLSDPARFEKLRLSLDAFPDLLVVPIDHVRAAEMSNECRRHGVATTTVDMLICAVAHRVGAAVYTLDRDFAHYGKHLPILLHEIAEPD